MHKVAHVDIMQQNERIGNETPVAPPPEGFRAHDGCGLLRAFLYKRLERGREGQRLHVVGVAAKGRVPKRYVLAIRPALAKSAQLRKPLVGRARKVRDPLRHPFGPNVWMHAALRNAAHVHDRLHVRVPNECGQLDGIGGAVPKGKNCHHSLGYGGTFADALMMRKVATDWSHPSAKDLSRGGFVNLSRAWSLSLDDAGQAVDARSHFVEFLQRIQSDNDFIATAELIFGELSGNVVRHAPGPVEIAIDLNEASVILHVIDSGPLLRIAEHRLPDDILSEQGRGLYIVEQLGAEVRFERNVAGATTSSSRYAGFKRRQSFEIATVRAGAVLRKVRV